MPIYQHIYKSRYQLSPQNIISQGGPLKDKTGASVVRVAPIAVGIGRDGMNLIPIPTLTFLHLLFFHCFDCDGNENEQNDIAKAFSSADENCD